MVLLREPHSADAPHLGRLHAAAWQAAYRDQMPADFLATVTADRRTAMWERVLSGPRPDGERITVADVGGVPVGFAWTGPCRDRDDSAIAGAGELFAINVAPESWGSGAGAALLEAAHGALTEGGFEVAVLWVLPGNARARRFYERSGWAADGVVREDEAGGVLIPEVRYARRFAG